MKMAIILLSLMASLCLQAAEISAQTEAFILSTETHRLYIKILNGNLKGELGWVAYSKENPTGKIFDSNPIDHLARPTDQVNNALYIQFPYTLEIELDAHSLTEEMKKRMNENLFTSLDRYVPISNGNVIDVATDRNVSCPEIPKRKNGEDCLKAKAFRLPLELIQIIKEEAQKVAENPALVASIIQHESLFDVFTENLHEKNNCLSDETNCSPYRWGVGLAQLGKTDAGLYGLDWEKTLKKPSVCKGKDLTDKKCLETMLKSCKAYRNDSLRPINCPRAAIRAAALKIASMIPKYTPVWVKESGVISLKDLTPILKSNAIEEMRNKVGLYNRSIKVINSFVEFFDQNGEFPSSYGEAWSQPRTGQSPSISMGHQMLTKEYINRCYVWEVAGLCDKLPNDSLVVQFQEMFNL